MVFTHILMIFYHRNMNQVWCICQFNDVNTSRSFQMSKKICPMFYVLNMPYITALSQIYTNIRDKDPVFLIMIRRVYNHKWKSVKLRSYSLFEGHNPLPSIFSPPNSCQALRPLLFFEIFPTPLLKITSLLQQ